MGTLAERKSLSFHCKLESGLPGRVLTDKYLLQDILRRILDNAIRFASSGSVYMQAGCSNPDGEGLELTFEISDAGSGISQETWDSIEAPLNELQIQGLSLRIVRRRLEALGGSIALVPTRPEGTGVVLRMPVLVGAGNSEKPAAPVHGSAKAPLKILLAEDSHDSFLLFKSYVKTEGHEVVRAMDGLEAFEMVQRDEFDYIVMDVNMPRMDGYSATRLIREWETDQGRARLPILLLSADDLERQGRLGGAAGCSGFLQKPTNKTRVLAALNYYLPNEAAQGGGRLASA
jgi:CheY-like chemotaxis protein